MSEQPKVTHLPDDQADAIAESVIEEWGELLDRLAPGDGAPA